MTEGIHGRNPLADVDWRKAGMPAGGVRAADIPPSPRQQIDRDNDPHMLMNRLKELGAAYLQERNQFLQEAEVECRNLEQEIAELRQMREMLGRGVG